MKSSTIRSCLLGAAALGLSVAPRPALAHGDEAGAHARAVIVRSGDSTDGGQNQTFEINANDGKVSVKVDGKEIAANRLRFENGRVVILDEKGNEIKDLNLFVAPGGDEDDHLFKVKAEMEAANQPPPPVMLGIQMSDPGPALRSHLHLEEDQTALVFGIYEGLPAQKGGIEQYDIIVAINGKRPAGPKEIRDFLANKSAGDSVRFTVIHEGQTAEHTVKLEAYDADRMKQAHALGISVPEGGVEWAPLQGLQFKGVFDPNKNTWYQWLNQAGVTGRVTDEIKEQLRGQLPDDLDSRLERLDQRVDEIKKLIDALIEQAREITKESQGPGSR